MAAAVTRRTAGGEALGDAERVAPRAALDLFLGPLDAPGGPPRRVVAGTPADLCLLHRPLAEVLAEPDAAAVRMSMVGGQAI
jgi:hypothetical protein